MPKVWDEATYNKAYRIRIRDGEAPDFGQWISYGRRFAQRVKGPYTDSLDLYIERWQALQQIGVTGSVLIVGCGFGYLVEVMRDDGMTAVGTDISAWIQMNKATEARADIAFLVLNINIEDADAVSQFQVAVGGSGKFNWVITEQVVESLNPATELQSFLDACDNLRDGTGGVVHIFSGLLPNKEGGTSPHNWTLGLQWRSLADWVAERSAHYWLNLHGNVVSGGT